MYDCWKPYFKYGNCKHALCNVHLLRELLGVVENTGQVWAGLVMGFLCEAKQMVERCKEEGLCELPDGYCEGFALEYGCILEVGLGESLLLEGHRGRSGSWCLLDRFIVYRAEVCRFLEDFSVPFDNNQAERDIWCVEVKQKVSGGFRSVLGAKNFGKISSIIGRGS
ncbi:transposase [Candidatus Bathycorpusculum sp.]|uniref:IS66 family transposase n=1 Tax=Candidatus Bathycorpusculum sp. TaxID=2994959 RepID=UPI00282AD6E2|nr:transposase [Candidatus Termitimicrobium sp.]MCL2686847.1 transposase [Candidatus Termitimicrobium sp.]